jgi:type VI protein secretion system component VasK
MLLSTGEFRGAGSALLLALGNVTAVTLAAILTFLWRGMSPRNWWLADRARTSTYRGVVVFVALLAGLAALIVLSG